MTQIPRALSVRQPWGWAIVHGGKPVENRSWYTDYRGPLLIHVSGDVGVAEFDDAAMAILEIVRPAAGAERAAFLAKFARWGLKDPDKVPKLVRGVMPANACYRPAVGMPFGGIVGRAELVDVISPGGVTRVRPGDPTTAMQVRGLSTVAAASRWYTGGFGFVLDNVVPTPFVPCKGEQGLWIPSDDILAQLETAA